MSTASGSYSGGIYTTQFNTNKIFGFGSRFRTGTYTAGGGGATLAKGTVMGRIFATGKLVPCVSTATDGSQIPVGVLAHDYTVGASATTTVLYCFMGDVNASMLVFSNGTDTLATVILFNTSGGAATTTEAGTIEDILVGKQINPITFDENTLADN